MDNRVFSTSIGGNYEIVVRPSTTNDLSYIPQQQYFVNNSPLGPSITVQTNTGPVNIYGQTGPLGTSFNLPK